MNKADEGNKLRSLVAKALADHIGVEADDIKDDDFFFDDLHMNPTELTDFVHEIESLGVDSTKINLEELETFEDLLDQVSQSES
jgi:hypothetical protein